MDNELMRLVRAFTSEEGHSLVGAMFDALSPDDKHAFEAEVEAYHQEISDMRAALKMAETQSDAPQQTEKP